MGDLEDSTPIPVLNRSLTKWSTGFMFLDNGSSHFLVSLKLLGVEVSFFLELLLTFITETSQRLIQIIVFREDGWRVGFLASFFPLGLIVEAKLPGKEWGL